MLSRRLFVCLLAGLCSNHSNDFHNIRWKGTGKKPLHCDGRPTCYIRVRFRATFTWGHCCTLHGTIPVTRHSFYSNILQQQQEPWRRYTLLMIAILVVPLCIMEVALIIGFNCNWIRPQTTVAYAYFVLQYFDTVGWATGRASVCKKSGCWLVGETIWQQLCQSYSSNCHHHLHDPYSNKIKNGDVLVLANPGPPGKWPVKRREIWKENSSTVAFYLLPIQNSWYLLSLAPNSLHHLLAPSLSLAHVPYLYSFWHLLHITGQCVYILKPKSRDVDVDRDRDRQEKIRSLWNVDMEKSGKYQLAW